MNTPVIHIENLSVSYGQTKALSDIRLDVEEGEYLGIIGPNGGGKSTLLKVLLGLAPAYSGTVRVLGEKPGRSKGRIGYVPQSSALDKGFPITAEEAVMTGCMKAGLHPFFRYAETDRQTARSMLEKVGIQGLAGRRISDLSGGEFQRMLIARALAAKPKLLLLDEPTASVDASSRERIYALLSELNRGMTILLVTHDLLAISSQVRQLACLSSRLVYHGTPELTQKVAEGLYGCPIDLIAHGVPHRVLKEHEEEKHLDQRAV